MGGPAVRQAALWGRLLARVRGAVGRMHILKTGVRIPLGSFMGESDRVRRKLSATKGNLRSR